VEQICEGRVAIVTGGGRGLGRSHALELARRGARVVVNDLGGAPDGTGSDPAVAQAVAEEIRAAGGEAVASPHDVSDFAAAGELVRLALDTFGRLDVLVNNAGILRDRSLAGMSEDEWDDVGYDQDLLRWRATPPSSHLNQPEPSTGWRSSWGRQKDSGLPNQPPGCELCRSADARNDPVTQGRTKRQCGTPNR
jgi:hypothetical protein